MQGRAAPKRVGCGWSSGARQSRVIEANLLRVAAELPVEPVGSRPERMPDGSIAADDHRVLQQLVRVLEHAMKKSDDEELRLIAKTYTASYPNAQQAIAHLFTQRLPPRQLIAALKAVVAPAPAPPEPTYQAGGAEDRVRVFREACERADRGKRGRVPLTFVRHAVDVAGLLAPRDEVEDLLRAHMDGIGETVNYLQMLPQLKHCEGLADKRQMKAAKERAAQRERPPLIINMPGGGSVVGGGGQRGSGGRAAQGGGPSPTEPTKPMSQQRPVPPEELKAQLRKQVGRLGHACEAECRRQGAGKPQGADALGMYELKRLCREHLPLIEPRAVNDVLRHCKRDAIGDVRPDEFVRLLTTALGLWDKDEQARWADREREGRRADEAQKLFQMMDLDGNGQIDANEFLDYQRRR